MSGTAVQILRVLLVMLFGGTIAVQLFAGVLAAPVLGGAPGVVLTCLIVAGGLCVEAVLVSVWMLAGMVRDESIFDARSRADRWTNIAIGSLSIAAVLAAGAFIYFLIDHTESAAPTEAVLAIIAAAAAGVAGALALLVTVMRWLLHTAIQYQSDLSEVI